MTTTSASSSALLQSLGVGSGLNISSIIDGLMQNESQPLAALQRKAAGIQTEISLYGQLSSAYSQVQGAIDSLRSADSQNSLLGLSVGTGSAAIANATISGPATAGSYALTVTKMAQGQQLVSTGGNASDTAAIGGGTLSISLGTISGGTLSGTPGTYSGATFAASGSPASVTIPANASLAQIRDAINNANAGVSATLVNDGTNYRLALSSKGTGANTSISISATGDSALVSLMSENPQGTQGFQQTQAASDFAGTVNGIAVSGPSNNLSKTVSGLNITAYGVGATTITVSQNAGAAAGALGSFVTAWNSLNTLVRSLSSYDPATKVAGPLLGDPMGAQTLNSMLQNVFGSAAPASAGLGSYGTLAGMGISVDSHGAMSIDSAKLGAALKARPTALADLLSSSKGDILGSASKYAASLVGSSGFGAMTSSLNDQLAANQKQQDSLSERLGTIRKNLTAQYAAMDQSVAKFQSLSSYLSNQIAQFNKAG